MKSAPKSTDSERFFASGLDLELVRGLFERLARTTLGARAIRELAPRTDDGARAALRRVAELVLLAASGEQPAFGGVSDLRAVHAVLVEFHRPLDREELALLHTFLSASRRLCAWFHDAEIENGQLLDCVKGCHAAEDDAPKNGKAAILMV